jgi:hypothetical protein
MWPLVSAAGPKSNTIPSFICTQSGFQHSNAPLDGADNFHCPLCVVSVDGAVQALPAAPSWGAVQPIRVAIAVPRVFHPEFTARPPPSHAPPALR